MDKGKKMVAPNLSLNEPEPKIPRSGSPRTERSRMFCAMYAEINAPPQHIFDANELRIGEGSARDTICLSCSDSE